MTKRPSPNKPPKNKDLGRAWQRMLSGRRLDLLEPSPLDVEIEDIAHGLSRVARWNGQTAGDWAFSVAQHSVLVDDLAGRLRAGTARKWRLAVLLHDAPEYVIGDLITPFKAAVGIDYKALEQRLMQAVRLRFGLPGELPAEIEQLIKQADRAAAYLEATQLAGFERDVADHIFEPPPRKIHDRGPVALHPLPPHAAKRLYLERFIRHAPKSLHPTLPSDAANADASGGAVGDGRETGV
jgi:5'-deoxynucleotidase YfbR-like HD superfamily hydrolase